MPDPKKNKAKEKLIISLLQIKYIKRKNKRELFFHFLMLCFLPAPFAVLV